MARQSEDDPGEGSADLSWGVGSVAARLGISASTLRTWERRYGVGPTGRTAGGHRRYTETDIDRVSLTQRLISRGAPPSDAARVAHGLDAAGLASALESEDMRRDADVGAAEDVIDGILSAATASDSARISALVGSILRRRGVVDAWTSVVAPSLILIGHQWSIGRLAIEAERLASEAIVGELRAHTRSVLGIDRSHAAVVLASAEDDQHSLPVFALESALAEAGLSAHVLGATLPAEALAGFAHQTQPDVVFLWASLTRGPDDPVWAVLADLDPRTSVVLGGPGWPRDTGARSTRIAVPPDLRSTVDHVVGLVGRRT